MFVTEERDEHEFFYRIENDRGDPPFESAFSPGYFLAHLAADTPVTFIATTHGWERLAFDPEEVFEQNDQRLAGLVALNPKIEKDEVAAQLAMAADQFIVGARQSVGRNRHGSGGGHVREDALRALRLCVRGRARPLRAPARRLRRRPQGGARDRLRLCARPDPAGRPRRATSPSSRASPASAGATAGGVVIDLKDKVGGLESDHREYRRRGGRAGDPHTEPRDALVGLGMTVSEAEGIAAPRSIASFLPVEERVRLALTGAVPGRGGRMSTTSGPRASRTPFSWGRGGVRPLAAAARPGRVRGPGAGQGAALDLPRGGAGARRAVRARPPGWPAGPRQDVARGDHRRRDGLVAAGDVLGRPSTARPTWRPS